MEFEYFHYVKDANTEFGLRAVSNGTTLAVCTLDQFNAEFDRINRMPLVIAAGRLAYAIGTDSAGDRWHIALDDTGYWQG